MQSFHHIKLFMHIMLIECCSLYIRHTKSSYTKTKALWNQHSKICHIKSSSRNAKNNILGLQQIILSLKLHNTHLLKVEFI